MELADLYNVYPEHEDPAANEQDSTFMDTVAGFVHFGSKPFDGCGLCRRGICVQRYQVEVGRDALVIHGSYVA